MALIKTQSVEPVAEESRQAPRDCASLIASLTATDPIARRWAARDLVDCPEAAAALVERLKQESEVSVREVILTTLTNLGDPVAVAGLVDCLRSEDAALRNEAIEAMQKLPDAVAPMMRELLADPDSDLRIFAVNILESLCHPEVETWLIEVIDRDPHVNVCGAAVDLLGEVGTLNARESLLRVKARFANEPYIRFAADLALGRLRET
ncbi:HEAT repeat domain-containing protein [Thiorhodococcus mannitoliphagus]|uniref:HEAT repeat domain-containing protein n=1 Tax=Thiorhodococcus mannitoliphagus TaxID=329406 RepID=A0A6P1DYG0_9GAMM|nr:HEAT repeat domain-containing protein [Thiorhodococcus mannitoliphagus]NEX22123.1 HEAT repeat domain-containing protein [Thiorhodococcus mannitoliphagus]